MHHSICDFISDIAGNAVDAGASLIVLDVADLQGVVSVSIADNGKGMDEQTLAKAMDPFFTDGKKHPRRKVGLGLPFLKQMIEQAHGQVDIRSEVDLGTSVFFQVDMTDPDAPPMGSMSTTLVSLLCYPGRHEMEITRHQNEHSYRVMRSELHEALGSLEEAASIHLARQYIEGFEHELCNHR